MPQSPQSFRAATATDPPDVQHLPTSPSPDQPEPYVEETEAESVGVTSGTSQGAETKIENEVEPVSEGALVASQPHAWSVQRSREMFVASRKKDAAFWAGTQEVGSCDQKSADREQDVFRL